MAGNGAAEVVWIDWHSLVRKTPRRGSTYGTQDTLVSGSVTMREMSYVCIKKEVWVSALEAREDVTLRVYSCLVM